MIPVTGTFYFGVCILAPKSHSVDAHINKQAGKYHIDRGFQLLNGLRDKRRGVKPLFSDIAFKLLISTSSQVLRTISFPQSLACAQINPADEQICPKLVFVLPVCI